MRHTEYTANHAMADAVPMLRAHAAERARWAAVLAAPSRTRTHYKPAPRPMPEWVHVGLSVVGFAFVGLLLAL